MALLRRILHPEGSDNHTDGAECFKNCSGLPPSCNPCITPAAIPEGFNPRTWFLSPPAVPLVGVNMTTPVAVGSHKPTRHLTLIALVISSVLAAFFLLVTYYVLFLRVRAHLRRRRAAAIINTPGGPGPTPEEDEDAAFVNQVDAGIHHVWFIRTVGLEQPMIDSITVCPYKRGDGLVESTDCSVCLSEFEEGELVRLLPKCCHAFHVPCIDTWLRSHLNCPLCRAPIVSPALPTAAPVEPAAAATPAAAAAPAGGPDSAVLDAAVAVGGSEAADADSNDDSSVGDEQQRAPSLRMIFPVPEDREETGIYGDSSSGTGNSRAPPPVASLSIAESGFRAQSDLGRSGIRQSLRNDDDEWVTVDLGPDHVIQPVRRSVSMDLSAMGSLFRRREEEEEDDDTEGAVSSRKANLPPCFLQPLPATPAGIRMMKQGRDRKGGNNLLKAALEMERCSSTNSGGYIFSRLARGRTRSHASILPL